MELRRNAAHPADPRNWSLSARWQHLDEGRQSTHQVPGLPFARVIRRGPDGRFYALQTWRVEPGGPVELHFSRWKGAPTTSTSPPSPRHAASDLSAEPGSRESRWLATRVQLGDPISDLRLPRLRRVPGAGLASYRRGRAARGRNISLAGQVERHRQALPRDHRRSESWLDAGTRRELDNQVLARLRIERDDYSGLSTHQGTRAVARRAS